MKFRSEIKIPPFPSPIDYSSKIFGLGSCFVDNIKQKLDFYRFQNQINPFGVIFNPYSINNILKRIIHQNNFRSQELFFHENLWKSFQLHSSFNQTDKEEYLKEINNKLELAGSFLKTSDWVFITLGTAWVYKLIKTDEIVSNCHKVPQKEFQKHLLSPTEISANLIEIIEQIKTFNPQTKILFSISPVRHLKDGFVENTQSKSHLHVALQPLIDKKNTFYFPSYEILMDDLRDYRFYKKDFVHPNELAIEYIWEKFQDSMISSKVVEDMKSIEKIQKQLGHRPFTKEKPILSIKVKEKILKIQEKYPHINFGL